MKHSSIIITLIIYSFGFIGCATLNDYKAKTTDEAEIKTILVKYLEAWENHDADSLISVIHEDARIMIGGEERYSFRDGRIIKSGQMVLSKKQYSEILPKRFRESLSYRWGNPEMNVRGDWATVSMRAITADFHARVGTVFMRDNGKWYIMCNPF